MKERFSKINSKFYIALSGILLGISIAFAEVGIIAYFALIPLSLVLYTKLFGEKYRARAAYLDGFIFFFSFDFVAFHWICYFYPLDFAGLTNVQAIGVIMLGWIGLSTLQSIFSAFVFVILSRIARLRWVRENPILIAFLAPALFAVNEWTQTLTWAGVPWGRIAISQTEMPLLLQTASLFGSYFLTFFIVLCNFLLGFAILHAEKRKDIIQLTCGILVAFVLLSTALFLIPTRSDEGLSVGVVQGNMPSQEQDGGMFYSGKLDTYCELSRKASDDGADIIIWPEGVFAKDINDYAELDGKLVRIKQALKELSVEIGKTIVIGTLSQNADGTEFYNSISVFYPDGEVNIGAYSKRRLVPFGEFLPLRDLVESVLPILSLINTLPTDLTPGEESTVFGALEKNDDKSIGALMCFDSIYESLGIDSARSGAEMLIIPSDDSWFYDSRALNMHHSQNILRAVEQGKYTVSCGNTGLSSIVSDKGVIVEKMPIFTEDYLVNTVYFSSHRTLYSYIGNLFVYICMGFVISPFAFELIHKKKK